MYLEVRTGMNIPLMTPTTPTAKRIATLFRRKLSTAWSPKEIKQYKMLVKSKCFENLDDLVLVETYYVFNEKKPNNYLRKDLYTFLNNWHGEVDRARTWAEHNKRKVKKANPNHEFGTATDDDFKRVSEEAKKMVADLRAKLRPISNVSQTPVDS
jgi:hypothetical protein